VWRHSGLIITLVVLGLAMALIFYACSQGDHHSATGEAARAKPYQATVNSDIYHRANCRWARKIAVYNLLGYDTPEDARKDGRRPCKVCRPP